ncbi:MAG: diguanylate cyclase [Acidobacteria bacterium]|nr:diguanylate cyclase [Acidobacteriota bacterium]
MNLSGYEFQVIFCVLILLSLASVALVVDYLKGMNEKLRERHIDLMARHETVVQRVEEDNTKLLRALAEQSKTFREMTRKSIAVNTVVTEEALPEITLKPTEEPIAPQIVDEAPVVSASGTVAVVDPEPAPVEASEESLPPNVIRIRLKPNESPEPAKTEIQEPDFEKFLEDLVTEFEEPVSEASTNQTESLGSLAQQLESFEDTLQVPTGTHPPSTLNHLVNTTTPFTGLVLAVGINEYMKLDEIHGHAAAEELLNTVDALMGEVAGENGFCSRSSDDEFVLLFPKLTGAPAQQRLSEISEKLWNYQLQSLGTFSVVFSWGASESQRQPLTAALNIATDNMAETRSSRKHSAAESEPKRRATA